MTQPPKQFRTDIPDLFWPWLAGFLDGDGCIGLYGKWQRPLVSVSQKERHILDVIVKTLGVGSVAHREQKKNGSIIHGITWGSAASKTICERCLPYLVTPFKRERALLCIAWTPISREERKNAASARPEFKQAIKLYQSGVGMSTIAKRLGVNAATILSWLKRAGVPRRSLAVAQQLRRERAGTVQKRIVRGPAKQSPEESPPSS